ncbi:BMP family protein [Allopusillimonas ginsengisoli]|uniref:BMP family protein n=1 Tax=Allopusillimonas ginsengisoli TaxID=453575 RepID=UPI001020877C|nr:BMP family protein [Allopusillimonas ginsengisoli]TEA76988.1 BMP family ABC transporter substrate-binding protein [Allopusillimonas ginsengisoli]
MFNPLRRKILLAASVSGLAACSQPLRLNQDKPKVAALFCGSTSDGGFMQAGYEGLMLAQRRLGVTASYLDKVANETEAQAAGLEKLAAAKPDLIIAHGGQNNKAAERVAAAHPDILFVVTQGSVTGSNLSSYDVLQEESAWLGGAYAAMMTRTGVIGHQSGIRVPPGLRGRAAYADGAFTVNPKIKLLTNFSGAQDDIALADRVTRAQAKAGADIIFTMLNAGRSGTTEACRALGIKQIGNVADWVARDPEVFIGSAYADVGIGVFEACKDVVNNTFKRGEIFKVGLQNPEAVRLIMSEQTPEDVKQRIEAYRKQILSGEIHVKKQYGGPEFTI